MIPKLSHLYLGHELLIANLFEHRGPDLDVLLVQPMDAAPVERELLPRGDL
jgi:hypothetical protein